MIININQCLKMYERDSSLPLSFSIDRTRKIFNLAPSLDGHESVTQSPTIFRVISRPGVLGMVARCACFKVVQCYFALSRKSEKREISPTACGSTAIPRGGVQPVLVFCFVVTVTANMTTILHVGNFLHYTFVPVTLGTLPWRVFRDPPDTAQCNKPIGPGSSNPQQLGAISRFHCGEAGREP